MGITNKQQLFCQEYLKDLNATEAYKRAGYKGKGNTAEACASRMLSNAKIEIEISKLKQEVTERAKITTDRVVGMILEMAEDGEQEANRRGALDMLMKYTGGYEKDNKKTISVKYNSIDDFYEEANK